MSRLRIKTICFICCAVMCVFPFVGGYEAYSAEMSDKALISVNIPISARRGNILDTNGRLIAYSEEVKSICLIPSLFYADEEVNDALSRLISIYIKAGGEFKFSLPIDKKTGEFTDEHMRPLILSAAGLDEGTGGSEALERLYDIFGVDTGLKYAYEVLSVRFLAHVSGEDMFTLFEDAKGDVLEAAEALSANEPFVYVDTSFTRRYAEYDGMTLCPHLIGLISSGSGVEYEYSKSLAGRRGSIKEKYSILGSSKSQKAYELIPPTDGGNITLTIDKDIQLTVQKLLKGAIEDSLCSAGAICVCDCKNGDILAIASAPGFDLNEAGENYEKLAADKASPLFDRSLFGLYRPGSTMKTITAFAALNEGLIDKDTFLWCGRYYPLGDTTFSCLYYHGFEDVTTALRDSCNVFFYKCSQALGVERLSTYQQAFGLGRGLDIGLQNAAGRVVTKQSIEDLGIVWSEGLLVQSGIGQSENAVTPLQMAQWAQIVANKGQLNTLGIIKGRDLTTQKLLDNDKAFELIHEGMKMAAENIWGEYSLSGLKYKAAIKTGTPENGHGYNSAVIGFYPADDPQVAFSIMLEDSESAYTLVRGLLEAVGA